jgi:hypothetical protein
VPHRAFADVYVQITEVKNREIFERWGQVCEFKGVSPDNDLIGVTPRAIVQSSQL